MFSPLRKIEIMVIILLVVIAIFALYTMVFKDFSLGPLNISIPYAYPDINFNLVTILFLLLGIIIPVVFGIYIIAYYISEIGVKIKELNVISDTISKDDLLPIINNIDSLQNILAEMNEKLEKCNDFISTSNVSYSTQPQISEESQEEDKKVTTHEDIKKDNHTQDTDITILIKKDINSIKELLDGLERIREELKKLRNSI